MAIKTKAKEMESEYQTEESGHGLTAFIPQVHRLGIMKTELGIEIKSTYRLAGEGVALTSP